jgi:hypothetical protein
MFRTAHLQKQISCGSLQPSQNEAKVCALWISAQLPYQVAAIASGERRESYLPVGFIRYERGLRVHNFLLNLVLHQSAPPFAQHLLCTSGIAPSHARRAYLSDLSIHWSTPLICRLAHSIREHYRADLVPHFAHLAKERRWIHTESVTHLSVGLSRCKSRNMIASSLVSVGSNRKTDVRWLVLRLGR